MRCPACGKENDERALFCDECGEILRARTAEQDPPLELWNDVKRPGWRLGVKVWLVSVAIFLLIFLGLFAYWCAVTASGTRE